MADRAIVTGLIAALAAAAVQAQAPDLPGQGGHSVPEVVRKEYDIRQLTAPPPLSEIELAGRRLFAQRCGVCHDPVGQGRIQGPWLDRTSLEGTREAAARQVIEQGTRRMPGFRHALTPDEIDRILAFLKTVTPEQNPRAATP
jgi:mono/diheme cytochrome c family protein